MILYIALFIAVCAISVPVANNYIKGSRGYAFSRLLAFSVFLLLFMVSAARIAVGNDYWPYVFSFNLISQDRNVASEIGFNTLVRFVQWMCHFTKYYVVVFAIISFFTCFFFVKGIYKESVWFAYSVFLLMANGFYYSSLNSVRYYLAVAVALYAIHLLNENRHYEFIFAVFCGALVHKSILIVVPIYYLCKINFRKWWHLIPAGFVASLFIFTDLYRWIMFKVYPYYEASSFDNGGISKVNVLKSLAVLAFSLIYYKRAIKDDTRNRFYFNLNIASLVTFLLWYIPEATRIGYYFSITNILLIPGILKKIEDKKIRTIWAAVIGICYLVYFAFYLKTCYQTNIRILPYRNWIFD